ncbi:MAG: carboxypeptidase regulatory-like domain-containing protein [Planctomycetes bacterium]|nr:carboxypeptidase regulatory-like domain-containing protein [Planctomycetota bacterium]
MRLRILGLASVAVVAASGLAWYLFTSSQSAPQSVPLAATTDGESEGREADLSARAPDGDASPRSIGEDTARQADAADDSALFLIRVVDDRGVPIEGATLQVAQYRDEAHYARRRARISLGPGVDARARSLVDRTDQAGWYAFSGNSTFRLVGVHAQADGHVPKSRAFLIDDSAHPNLEETLELQRTGSASIVVVDADGVHQPARIRLRPNNRSRPPPRVSDCSQTEPAKFEDLAPGEYVADAFKISDTGEKRVALNLFGNRRNLSLLLVGETVQVKPGERVLHTIELPRLSALTLRITKNGQPFRDGRVVLYAQADTGEKLRTPFTDPSQPSVSASRSIGPGGIVRFDRIQTGTRKVAVRAGRHALSHSFEITVDDDPASRDQHLDLETGHLTVRIKGGDGADLRRATLSLGNGNDAHIIPVRSARAIELDPLAIGSYEPILRDEYGEVLARATARSTRGVHTEVELRLESKIQVDLRVTDPTGNPTVAVVEVVHIGTPMRRTFRVAAEGDSIGLVPGTWSLRARGPSDDDFGPTRQIELRSGFPREVDLRTR